MTLDDLHELGRTDFAAAWRAALAWTRDGLTPELEWDDHGKTRYVNVPATMTHIDLSLNRVVDTWINPAWRWFHGDNHELVATTGNVAVTRWVCRQPGCSYWMERTGSDSWRNGPDHWFGLPKPAVRILTKTGAQAMERFHHVRDHAWLEAVGADPYRTLAELFSYTPGWPLLFAFHAWTAAWLARPEDEQLVYIDHVEERFVGDACRGRACEAKEAD